MLSVRQKLVTLIFAISVALAPLAALGQQYMPLPPNSVIGNVNNGPAAPANAVPLNELAASLMRSGGLVQGPATATPGHVVVFGSSPTSIVDNGAVAGSGTVTQVTCGPGLTGGTFSISGTCAQNGNYSGLALQNCTLAASVALNILTVALKDNSGGDPSATSPCNINYQNAGSGSTSLVQQTAPLSINTNATGATLGSSSGVAFRLWVVSFNNSGANVLALINCSNASTIFPLNEGVVVSSTAISGSATSAGVFYTPNGTTISSAAFRILGYIEYSSGLTTAGTYTSAPTAIQMFGPGVKKPGDVVQTAQHFDTGNTTSNSTTIYLATVVAQAISLTSAANLAEIKASGSSVNSVGSSGQATLSLLRGSTQIGPQLSQLNPSNATGSTSNPVTFDYLDRPATTSSTTYSVGIKCNSAALCSFPGGSNIGGNIIVQEIMG